MIRHGSSSLFYWWVSRFHLTLISVSFIVLFVLNIFSKFVIISAFSDCSVVFVAFWILCNVQLNSRGQSKPSISFKSSRSVISVFRFFWFICSCFYCKPFWGISLVLFDISTSFNRKNFPVLFFISLSSCNILTDDPVSTLINFSVQLTFVVMVLWFPWSVTCFI